MNLFTRTIKGNPSKPTLLIIHGLYSSGSNWYHIARATGYNVKLVDLPNHGRSYWSDQFNYRSAAEAIKKIIDTPCIALGHSFGGRVAMILAEECEMIKGLIMVDISSVSDRSVDRAFTLFHSLFLQHMVEARRAGVENIEQYLIEHGAPKEMTSAVDQAYKQMNVEAVAENITLLPAEWKEIVTGYEKIEKPALLIRGAASPYVPEAFMERYHEHFNNLIIETIEGGTHNLHHEYPENFVSLVTKFIETNF